MPRTPHACHSAPRRRVRMSGARGVAAACADGRCRQRGRADRGGGDVCDGGGARWMGGRDHLPPAHHLRAPPQTTRTASHGAMCVLSRASWLLCSVHASRLCAAVRSRSVAHLLGHISRHKNCGDSGISLLRSFAGPQSTTPVSRCRSRPAVTLRARPPGSTAQRPTAERSGAGAERRAMARRRRVVSWASSLLIYHAPAILSVAADAIGNTYLPTEYISAPRPTSLAQVLRPAPVPPLASTRRATPPISRVLYHHHDHHRQHLLRSTIPSAGVSPGTYIHYPVHPPSQRRCTSAPDAGNPPQPPIRRPRPRRRRDEPAGVFHGSCWAGWGGLIDGQRWCRSED